METWVTPRPVARIPTYGSAFPENFAHQKWPFTPKSLKSRLIFISFDCEKELLASQLGLYRFPNADASCLHHQLNALFPGCKKSWVKTSQLWTENATTRAIVNTKWASPDLWTTDCLVLHNFRHLSTKGVLPSLVVGWTWTVTFQLDLRSTPSSHSRSSSPTDATQWGINVSFWSRAVFLGELGRFILWLDRSSLDRASFDKRSRLGKIMGYYRNQRPASSVFKLISKPRGGWETDLCFLNSIIEFHFVFQSC